MKKKKAAIEHSRFEPFHSLTGQLLVSMPGIGDERFEQTVIYIYAHTTENGAAGLIINKPAAKTSFREILDELHIAHGGLQNPPPVLLGGPVQMTRGLILHSRDYAAHMTVSINDRIALTATQDILYDMARGTGPRHSLLTLGHAAWTRGQLEDEIMSNVWLTTAADTDLLFHHPCERRWEAALKKLGVFQPAFLAHQSGRA